MCRRKPLKVFSCFFIIRVSGGLRGSALGFVIQRWEPVFRGERGKVIPDRAKRTSFVFHIEKGFTKMRKSDVILKLVVLSLLIALGVVISPILRVEGMCPMAHLINIVCSVLMGPWYSLLCATVIGIIRMLTMGIPPLALTGAVFGAFLSGVFYRMSKGKILMAVAGEIIGTGIIGALASYPVMTLLWGKEGLSWLFYVPSFICGTLIGGSIAYVFLRKLASNGMLARMQRSVGSAAYHDQMSVRADALTIAALGGILWVVIKVASAAFGLTSPAWNTAAYAAPAAAAAAGLIYYVCKTKKVREANAKTE